MKNKNTVPALLVFFAVILAGCTKTHDVSSACETLSKTKLVSECALVQEEGSSNEAKTMKGVLALNLGTADFTMGTFSCDIMGDVTPECGVIAKFTTPEVLAKFKQAREAKSLGKRGVPMFDTFFSDKSRMLIMRLSLLDTMVTTVDKDEFAAALGKMDAVPVKESVLAAAATN